MSLSEPWKLPKLGSQEFAATILAALLFSACLAPVLTEGSGSSELGSGGSLLRQVIYLALFGLSVANAKRSDIAHRLFMVPFSITVVLAWCAISIAWAINPNVAVRRLILTTLIIWNVFMIVEQCGQARTIETIRIVLAVLVGASFVAVILAPGWAIHHLATEDDPSIVGAWKGILGQKNFAGAVCALTILFFGLEGHTTKPAWRWLIIAASAFFLYKTSSKTSMALLASSLGMVWIYRLYNPFYHLVARLVLLITVGILGLLAQANWAALAAPFSREDFLTGRTQIWRFLMEYIQDHWLLGSGFGSFWNIGTVNPIDSYTNGWVSQIASGHNGFLDLLTQTGVPGLVLAVWAVFLRPFSVLLSSPIAKPRGGLILACIWFCVWHNLTESSLFDRDETVEVFLMIGIALLMLESNSVKAVRLASHGNPVSA